MDISRLQLLSKEASPQILSMLGEEVSRYVPAINNLQVHEHNCCEFMQQHFREAVDGSKNQPRPRRCDKASRRVFKEAVPQYLVDGAHVIEALGAMDEPLLSDQELLTALCKVYSKNRVNGLWQASFVDKLCQQRSSSPRQHPSNARA